MVTEITLEDVGRFKGEISPYQCDHCGGPMAYLGIGRDVGIPQTVYALYIKCTDCGAGDIGGPFDDGLRPWPPQEADQC